MQGNHDILSLTQPDIVKEVHRATSQPAATSSAPTPSPRRRLRRPTFGPRRSAYELNCAGRKIARESPTHSATRHAASWQAAWGRPTARPALSPDVNQPGFRNVSFDELVQSYTEAIRGLRPVAPTCSDRNVFDTLNAKAAIYAAHCQPHAQPARCPSIISGTITDASGRTLSGQTCEAFLYSIEHANPWRRLELRARRRAVAPYVASSHSRHSGVSAHPNAGLPNAFGEYDQTPSTWPASSASSPSRLAQHRGRLLRHHARAHTRHRATVAKRNRARAGHTR